MRVPTFRRRRRGPDARLSPPGGGRALCSGIGASLLAIIMATPLDAQAQGIPVIDTQTLIQATIQAERALQQIDQLSKQYAKQIEQLSVAIEQRDALLGARGAGALLNGAAERDARRGVPATLEELLRLAEGGRVPTLEELRRLMDARERELELAPMERIGRRDAPDRSARSYERQRRGVMANLAVSEKAYGDAAQRVVVYEQLMSAIERTPDLKASTDLVSRLLAENGLTMNELVRLQALSVSAGANANAGELVGRSNLADLSEFDDARYRELVQGLRVRAADEP
jgi:type IV secretion system protein VirB5